MDLNRHEIFENDLFLQGSGPSPMQIDYNFTNLFQVPQKFQHKRFRTALELISAFENSENLEPKIENKPLERNVNLSENLKFNLIRHGENRIKNCRKGWNHAKSMSPQPTNLTPVKEESESMHSSGENNQKGWTDQLISPWSCEKNNKNIGKIGRTNNLSTIFEITEENFEGLHENAKEGCNEIDWPSPLLERIEKKQVEFDESVDFSVMSLKNELIEEKKKLDYHKEKAECLVSKISLLNSAYTKLNELRIDLQRINSCGTQNFQPKVAEIFSKIEDLKKELPRTRWILTYHNETKEIETSAYKHKSVLTDPILSELVLIFDSNSSRFSIHYKLFSEFKDENLNLAFNKLLDFWVEYLQNRFINYTNHQKTKKIDDSLESISRIWICFVTFSNEYIYLKSICEIEVFSVFHDRLIIIGTIFNKRWEYTISFSGFELSGLLTDFYSLLNN